MTLPTTRRRWLAAALLAAALLLLVRCATAPGAPDPQSIEVCGRTVPIGTEVVNWRSAPHYDAYQQRPYFAPDAPADGRLRYGPVRGNLPEAIAGADPLTLAELQRTVHLFVLHFDVCGTARQCFKILHDKRYLSVHFLLDVDGTIYQTLDLREKAFHATIANDTSIGIEIAHPGTFAQPLSADMRRWYARDEQGWFMRYLPGIEQGVRTPGFVPRPDRPEFVSGPVHGRTYHQFDFTPQQYRALAHLCAGLSRVFPRLRLDAPRDASGRVRSDALSRDELLAFDGIVGHHHVQTNKTDPGPALQWDRLLADARRLRGE